MHFELITKLSVVMSRTIKPLRPPQPSDFHLYELSTSLSELLRQYQATNEPFLRILMLTQAKNVILQHPLSPPPESQPVPGAFRSLNEQFTHVIGYFIERGYKMRGCDRGEVRLLYRVVSLAIKHYFSLDEFKALVSLITDLMETRRDRVVHSMDFLTEVIDTIEEEIAPEETQIRAPVAKCRFEWSFSTQHLNSMLQIANLLLILAVNGNSQEDLQDALPSYSFRLHRTQDYVLPIFRLLHRTISYFSDRQKDPQDDTALILIPVKANRSLGQFDRWIADGEMLRLYTTIFMHATSIELKEVIADILGDMGRVHMRFLRNKNNYRIYIENIYYQFVGMLGMVGRIVRVEDRLRVALRIGMNLKKLVSPAVVPMFFEMNPNFAVGIIDEVKNFISDQVIGEGILNSNVIYFYFSFLNAINVKALFQAPNNPNHPNNANLRNFRSVQQVLQPKMRDICGDYEHYLITMVTRLSYTVKPIGDNPQLRQDLTRLKQCLDSYNIAELEVYFMPFQQVRVISNNTNTIQQLLVHTIARFQRAISILEYRRQEWQISAANQILIKTLEKVREWYTFTSYYRRQNSEECLSRQSSIYSERDKKKMANVLETIPEQFEEEIENEYQHCHYLRIVCFYMLEQLIQYPQGRLSIENEAGYVWNLVTVTLELIFRADLEDDQSPQKNSKELYPTLLNASEQCLQLMSRVNTINMTIEEGDKYSEMQQRIMLLIQDLEEEMERREAGGREQKMEVEEKRPSSQVQAQGESETITNSVHNTPSFPQPKEQMQIQFLSSQNPSQRSANFQPYPQQLSYTSDIVVIQQPIEIELPSVDTPPTSHSQPILRSPSRQSSRDYVTEIAKMAEQVSSNPLTPPRMILIDDMDQIEETKEENAAFSLESSENSNPNQSIQVGSSPEDKVEAIEEVEGHIDEDSVETVLERQPNPEMGSKCQEYQRLD